uniref:Uncharacterized protein n=1 Tax=Acrobeloides nanus TaxID=290746 RepID=A0A914CS15_9BILA
MYKLLIICSIFLYAYAEVSLNNFFPYGPSQGDASMIRSDDGSSPQIDISTNYRFFGLNQSFLWINVNGAISFKSVINVYTPSCAPVVGAFSMISPYWADVDIRTTGNIYYRESRNSNVLQQANMEIRNAFPEIDNVNMTWAYIITWYNVTYYPDTDPNENKTRNFFQCALATDERFSYAIFYYNQMLWTTGDASGGHGGLGGTPAQAGFDAGDGVHRFMINGSCQNDINTTLVTKSNVGKPGVWVFSVANSTIVAPPTRSTITSTKKIMTTPTTTVKTTPTTAKATPTTTAPISGLSNSDGTPCSCNKPTMWLDIIVAIDKSKSIGVGGLGSIGSQLATMFYGANIAQGGSGYYSRVALVLFSSDVKVLGDLKTYTSYNDLVKVFLNLEGYHNTTDIVVDIYSALDTAQNIFESQSDTSTRQARKVVLLFASSYNQIGGNDPKTIANQMNNSNVFIVTVDYKDVGGAATELLSQISTPFMNFTSADETNGADVFAEVDQALCFANCICPKSMQQVITYNATSGRQVYWSDCIIPYDSGSFAQFAQVACKEIGGSLVSLTTSAKADIVINLANQKISSKRFHIGLHRNVAKNLVWYGYNSTEYPLSAAYQNWAPGFNSGSAGDCVYTEKYDGRTWGWMTENCLGQNPYAYICQVRACDSTYGTCDCASWFNDPSCS